MLDYLQFILTPLHADGEVYVHIGGVIVVSFLTTCVIPWTSRLALEVMRTVRALLRAFCRRF